MQSIIIIIALHAVYLKALVTYYQTFRINILIFASPLFIKTCVCIYDKSYDFLWIPPHL